MSYDNLLAGSTSPETFTPAQLLAGNADVRTLDNQVLDTGNLAQFTVVGRITATGKLVQWAPAATNGSEIAVGILCHAADASAADKVVQIYVGGDFNVDALVWPGSVTTLAAKQAAFDRTDITVRELMYSVG